MFKSIFAKYFTVISLILSISLMAIGLVQVLLSTQYWVADKKELLSSSNKDIADLSAQTARMHSSGTYDISAINYDMDIISRTIDAYMFIVELDGEIVMCSDSAEVLLDKSLTRDFLAEIGTSPYWEVGRLNGLFDSRYYTAGQPLIMPDGVHVGYIFTSSSADGLHKYMRENTRVFLLSSLGVLVLAFIAFYLMTYSMVRPLRQMASVTRSFGLGNFSPRVPVHGRDEVAELATALNTMAVSLSSVEGMRRSFVANVSHELKTPMTTISGFIDGILDGTIPPEKQRYYLNIVTSEVKRLSRLVKSMLDLTRIDNGELQLNAVRFDLTEMACGILVSFEPHIERKHIEIAGLDDCPRTEITADRDLIGQVVYNLIDNAVKFSDENGKITIRLYMLDGKVHFSIRNTGAGVPSEEMPHIFERFYKSDKSRSLDKNGMGLGLYIVKTIITLHNGEIVVRSAEGEFCEFEFWLSV